jgi:SAM-dependent methyltransferase
METVRKPFQGVWNIIRFNWHLYAIASGLILGMGVLHWYLPAVLLLVSMAITLTVSLYIYDLSGLYALAWIEPGATGTIVNIHAGFDETSAEIKRKFPGVQLLVFDFYDPAKHTEVSVKRARRAYPSFPGTRRIVTDAVPFEEGGADRVLVTFSAHEIRNDEERASFFKELNRILSPSGYVQVTEHLRDLPNFLAYNIGAFHFLSRKSWLTTFAAAGLGIRHEKKLNPFITTFILDKHDHSS